ncbi:unnamed protein product [Brassica oleracea var. botrytis]|uniref:(rape) hypothetical protein n=1 Tax=Brassica napus TaxID=3708 RepID=A0A816K942_BRANA|nr:unnamed protein product [Brassica napus]
MDYRLPLYLFFLCHIRRSHSRSRFLRSFTLCTLVQYNQARL